MIASSDFDHRHELVNDRLLRVGELLRDRFLLGELGIAIEVDLGILQVRLVAVAIGNRLIELSLVRAWVDLRRGHRLSSLADPGGS